MFLSKISKVKEVTHLETLPVFSLVLLSDASTTPFKRELHHINVEVMTRLQWALSCTTT